MKRKITSLVLAVIMVLSLIPVGAFAQGNCIISADAVTAEPGDTVTVNVTVENNPGILGLGPLSVSYDSSVLTLTNAVAGEAFSALTFTAPSRYKSGCVFSWYAVDISNSDIKDGTILTLTFTVSSSAADGVYSVEIGCPSGSVYDKDLNEVNPTVVNGSVTVGNANINNPTDECTLRVGTVNAEAGNTVTVDVSIENNPGILGMGPLSISYDSSALTLTNAVSGEAFSALTFTRPSRYKSGCVFSWYAVDIADSDIKDGTILTLTFTVNAAATDGTYDIEVSCPSGSVYDKNLNEINPAFVSGSITVSNTNPTSDCTVSVENAEAEHGDTVTLDIVIEDNPGIIGMGPFSVNYDGTALTLTNAVNGEAFSKLTLTQPSRYRPGCVFSWYAVDIADSDIKDGTILTITFTVNSTATDGTYEIEVSCPSGSVYDKNLNEVTPSFASGVITVTSNVNYEIGDVNRDGKVDFDDISMIISAAAGDITLTSKETELGDVNGDGVVDAFDAAAIEKVSYYNDVQIGDVDFDGDFDLNDYAIVRSYISGEDIDADHPANLLSKSYLDSKYDGLKQMYPDGTIVTPQYYAADVNGDKAVDAFDLFLIDKMIDYPAPVYFTYNVENGMAVITSYIGTDEHMVVPDTVDGYNVVKIDVRAFRGNTAITQATISGNVATIDNYAFMDCVNLSAINLSDGLQKISYGSFLNCRSLQSVVLPETVTSIGSYAFKGCTALTSVYIPASVTTIQATAFNECPNLTIYGESGSYAQTYANSHSISFVATS